MPSPDRRRFLSSAVLGGSAVAALGSLAPETAFAAPRIDLDPRRSDPNFAESRITAIDSGRLHLRHNGKKVVGHVVNGTTAAVYNHTPAIADLSGLQVGKHVKVIGAWRPDTNEVDIATVYAGV